MTSHSCVRRPRGLLITSGFFAVLFIFALGTLTWATTEYTCLTDKSCSYCHENPHGGGILSSMGEGYRKAGYVLTADIAPSAWGPSFRLIIGFIHILAAVIWFGTIFYIHLFVKPRSLTSGLPKNERILGWICIFTVGITGIVLTIFRVHSLEALWTTTFGVVWIIKVVFFLFMVAIAGIATTRLNRRMRQAHEEAGENHQSAADGKEGRPGHLVYAGELYDVSESKLWKDGVHMGRHFAGGELTEAMSDAPHGPEVLQKVKKLASAQAVKKGGISKPAKTFGGEENTTATVWTARTVTPGMPSPQPRRLSRRPV